MYPFLLISILVRSVPILLPLLLTVFSVNIALSVTVEEIGIYHFNNKDCRKYKLSDISLTLQRLIKEIEELITKRNKDSLVFINLRDASPSANWPASSSDSGKDFVVGINPQLINEWGIAHELIHFRESPGFHFPSHVLSDNHPYKDYLKGLENILMDFYITQKIQEYGFDISEHIRLILRIQTAPLVSGSTVHHPQSSKEDWLLVTSYLNTYSNYQDVMGNNAVSPELKGLYNETMLRFTRRFPHHVALAGKIIDITKEVGVYPEENYKECIKRIISDGDFRKMFHLPLMEIEKR